MEAKLNKELWKRLNPIVNPSQLLGSDLTRSTKP